MAPRYFPAHAVANHSLGGGHIVLEFCTAPRTPALGPVEPGQFVMVRGEWGRELLNPRAFSVLWSDDDRFAILLKAHGEGTRRLAGLRVGDPVQITGPLGRGFAAPTPHASQFLVAGGVGLPPLHLQARRAHSLGLAHRVRLFYGGRSAQDLVLLDDFARWGVQIHLATEDGSRGHGGFVTVPLGIELGQATDSVEILACGPTPMLAAVRKMGLAHNLPTWLCLEEQMACGFGVCLGCAIPTHGAVPYRYCCTDGPVFDAATVRWP